jgi:hypothetical protein
MLACVIVMAIVAGILYKPQPAKPPTQEGAVSPAVAAAKLGAW